MVDVISRAQWGARYPVPGGRNVAPTSRRYFVVHWPASNAGGDEAAIVRNIEQQHRNQGWDAVPGYNFLVGMSGRIYEGCGRDTRGIHSPPRNTDGFGCCVLQPMNADPSQAALDSTKALYNELCRAANRELTRSYHGADYATACPGAQLIAWVKAGMPSSEAGNPTKPATGGAMDLMRNGDGYYITAADGGVFAFNAPFFGSMGDVKLNAPVVGGAVTESGQGYWLVGSDGGVFCFGDAQFHGSMGGRQLAAPITGITAAPGGGYWLLGRDGGVFAFGGAPFHGSGSGHVKFP